MTASPKTYARIGGAAYLLIILAGLFGEMYVRGNMIVSGDPAATAKNIMASPTLWRLGIAGDLIMHTGDVVVMWVYYILFSPVNKKLVILAILFNLVQTTVLIANKINLLMSLFFLSNADYLKTLDAYQLQTQAYLFIKLHGYGFGVGLIYFGFGCLIIGYLIIKSGYIPKVFGYLLQLSGICYLVNSFSMLIAPTFQASISSFILMIAFVGEFSFCLWLLIKGVNMKKWNERSLVIVDR